MSEHESLHDRIERLEELAIEAELETGRREETVEEAKRHILVRIGRVILGVIVSITGIILMPLPGPGTLTLIAGLAILASEIPFFKRLLDLVRDRVPQDEHGKVSKKVIAASITVSVLSLALSLWWSFFR